MSTDTRAGRSWTDLPYQAGEPCVCCRLNGTSGYHHEKHCAACYGTGVVKDPEPIARMLETGRVIERLLPLRVLVYGWHRGFDHRVLLREEVYGAMTELPANRRDRPSAMQSDLAYIRERQAEAYRVRYMPGGQYMPQRGDDGRVTVRWRRDGSDSWIDLPDRFNSIAGALDHISTDPKLVIP